MKRSAASLLCMVFCAMSLISCDQREEASNSAALAKRATEFVELLASGNFTSAATHCDNNMRQGMPPEKLQEAWGGLIGTLGAFQKQAGVRTATEQGYDVAYVTCEFAKGTMAVKVVFNRDRQVSGLWFVPPQ